MHVDGDGLAGQNAAFENFLCNQRFDRVLDIPAQRTRTELRVIGGVDDQLLCSLRQLAVQLFVRKTLVERVNLQIDDARDVLFGERFKNSGRKV